MVMEITATQIKNLRDNTGAGFLDCRRALLASDGDFEKAVQHLQRDGMVKAAKKVERVANEGIVEVYQHHTGGLGVILEINCQTDFAALSEPFRRFARELALHIANDRPLYIRREDIPQYEINAERAKQHQKTVSEGKPEAIVEKIVNGRMEKWFGRSVLLEQNWLHDEAITVGDALARLIAEIGENVVIRRFARYALNETVGEDDASD